MTLRTTAWQRRDVLLAPLMGGVAWFAESLVRPAAAQEKATLIAKRVDRLPEAADDPAWVDRIP